MSSSWRATRSTPARVERVDVTSGRDAPLAGLGRALPSFYGQTRLLVTPDGAAYAYGYMRQMSDLYLTFPSQVNDQEPLS